MKNRPWPLAHTRIPDMKKSPSLGWHCTDYGGGGEVGRWGGGEVGRWRVEEDTGVKWARNPSRIINIMLSEFLN